MGNGGGWELHTPDESKLLFTHTREWERERERKGQQREHGTTKFSAYPSFPLFRSLAGREEKFLLPKSCHDEGMKYKKSYCRKRSRGASSTSREERRKRKKEEKCRTRQLFFVFFFLSQVIYYFFFLFESEMPRASWSKKLCRSMANPSDALPRTAAVDGCDSRPRPAVSQLRRPRNSMALMMP